MNSTDSLKTKRINGDGSVFFRTSDSRWCASLSLPSEVGSRRVTRSVPDKGTQKQQKTAAEATLTNLRRERDTKGDIPTAILNVETWARKWLTEIAMKEVRPKTAAAYRTNIEQYIIPAIGRKQLRKLSTDDVRQVESYIIARGLTRSAASAYQTLHQLLDSAMREGKITRNVAELVKRPRVAKKDPTILTAQHGMKVLQAVTGWPPPVAIDRLASRWWAALFTGARQGELLGLEWDRVDFERGVLDLSWQLQRLSWEHGCKDTCTRIRGTDCPKRKLTSPADWEHRHIVGGLWWSRPKSNAGWRIIPLVSPLREMLEMRLKASVQEPNTHGLVWTQPSGRPLDPSRDNAAWHAALALAGVPDARLHDARHATASLLLAANVPEKVIMQILGHSSVVVTRGYQHVDIAQTTEALTRMSALMISSDSPSTRGD